MSWPIRPIFIKQRFCWWINKMVSKVHLVFDFYSSLYYFTSSNGYCCKLIQVQKCALITTFFKPRPFGLLPAFLPTCGPQHDGYLGSALFGSLLQTFLPTALRSTLLYCIHRKMKFPSSKRQMEIKWSWLFFFTPLYAQKWGKIY